ncbi:vWA domain-containing protein [Thiohalorhabdus sp. Cl-TMA]|uniref:VWA domain-containing protein n=1 Tax=Thiohalorhabdus methylotrophus TaxID=3242694 RepID=A0ABV4TTS1_9GAMM
MKTSKVIGSLLLAIPLATASFSAQAVPMETALGIVIDGSGSISGSEFATQQNAYASVLGNASLVPANGSIAVNLVQFSSNAQLEQTALRIESSSDRDTLVDAINDMSQLDGSTSIGSGIERSRINMDSFLSGFGPAAFSTDFRKLIDVSTDGEHNTGYSPSLASQQALGDGYTKVNCLGIGNSADCTWNPSGSSDFDADSFEDLEPVLTQKVGTELDTIPAPSSLALLGASLFAFGAIRGRKSEA